MSDQMPDKQTWPPFSSSASRTVEIEGKVLTLHNQAWIARWRNGGWVWNRPALVTVTDPEGTVQRIPVVDVTRLAQWTFLGLAALFALIGFMRR